MKKIFCLDAMALPYYLEHDIASSLETKYFKSFITRTKHSAKLIYSNEAIKGLI